MNVGTQLTLTTAQNKKLAMTITGRIGEAYTVVRTGFTTVGRGVLDVLPGQQALLDRGNGVELVTMERA